MHESARRVLTGVVFFLLTVLIAILGYVWFGWTPLEAIYMVVITIFGVGYGEVKPLDTPFQKIFTILVIIAGTTSAVYSVGGFVQMVTEGEINRAFSNQRKQLTIANLQDHVIICGFDRMGQVLARQLDDAQQPFVIVENQPDRIEVAEASGYLHYPGDGTHEITLEEVGIHRAKALVAVLPDDKANVFITLTARISTRASKFWPGASCPPPSASCAWRGRSHRAAGHHQRHPDFQFDCAPDGDGLFEQHLRTQLPERISRQRGGANGRTPDQSRSPFVDKTLMELQVRGKGAFMIIALRRLNDRLIFRPPPPSC
jgi:voltage-gated potassium channel